MRRSHKWIGEHRDVTFEIVAHGFREDIPEGFRRHWDMKCTWCTYMLIGGSHWQKEMPRLWSEQIETTQLREDFPKRYHVQPLPVFNLDQWNGGQTFYEQTIDFASGWKRIKIGDDFAHLWDTERQDFFDEKYMERHIKNVIDEFLDKLTAPTGDE